MFVNEKKMWDNYLGDRENLMYQQDILKYYQPVITKIAMEILRGKPQGVELEDLMQAGGIGLLHALERFNPDRGVKFTTFMNLRVRGAMFDEINDLDWTPRVVRDRLKLLIKGTDEFKSLHGREPEAEELLEFINEVKNKTLTMDQLLETKNQLAKTYIYNVTNELAIQQENSVGGADHIIGVDSNKYDVEDSVIQSIESSAVSKIIKEVCTPEERIVIYYMFHQEESIRGISRKMNMSSNKISQLKKSALNKIEAALLSENE